MSANDCIAIIKVKGGYKVQHRDREADSFYKEWKVKTALQALRVASKIESEYGIIYCEYS